MKKFFALFALFGMLTFGLNNTVLAKEGVKNATDTTISAAADSNTTTQVDTITKEETVTEETTEEETAAVVETPGFHQQLKQKFIEGGPGFMSFVLISLILGLAIAIERIIYLNLASTNTTKLLVKIEDALNNGGTDAAKEVCRNTPGPVASIFYQGLDRFDSNDPNTIEIVEKSVVAYGGVQMGRLEKGLTWIALFIALAPMLGFMGHLPAVGNLVE